MNKKHYLSLVLILSIIVCMMPFSSVKAMSQVRPEVNKTLVWNGVNVGWYNHYAYLTSNSNEVINTSQFGVGPVGYYKTVDVITVGFNDPYSGEIMFGFTGSLSNYQLVYIDGENTGSYRWSGSNQVLYVSFDNCLSFDIYMYSTTQYTSSNLQTKIDVYAFTELTLYSAKIGSSYSIPLESLPAYMFPCHTLPELSFEHGDLYPEIHIDHNDQELQHSKKLSIRDTNIGDPIYWVFICKQVIYDTSYTVTKSDNSSTDDLDIIMSLYPSYITGTNTDEYFYIYRFKYYGSGTVEMWWNDDLDIIPIYLGHKGDCPSKFYSLCGFGGDPVTAIAGDMNEISTMIDAILTLLSNSGDSGQTAENIDDINDELNDITSDIDAIEADIDDLFDSHITNIDLDDYDIFDDMVNTNLFFKTYLDDVFTNLGDFKAVIIVPVIVTVMMIMLGWVL